MASQIVTLQDNAGNNLYPQVKWGGVADFPTDYLKRSDIKKTLISSSDLTLLNGATIWETYTWGMLLEFPEDFAILYLGTHFLNVTCDAWGKIEIAQLPTSFFSKYSNFQAKDKPEFSKGMNWLNCGIDTTSARLYVSPRANALSKDSFEWEQTMYMSK